MGAAAELLRRRKSRTGKGDRVKRPTGRYPNEEYKNENAYEKPRIMHLHTGIVSKFREKSLQLFANNLRIVPGNLRAIFSHNERVGAFAGNQDGNALIPGTPSRVEGFCALR